jgi:hypothetical protein
MKNFSIYFFKIKLITELDELSDCGADIISEIGEDFGDFIAFNEYDEYEIIFCFLEDYKIHSLLNIFEKHGLLIESKNITSSVLMSRFKNELFEEIFQVEEFNKMLENFLLSNLTINNVLDKINEQGIDSLTETDKIILQNI